MINVKTSRILRISAILTILTLPLSGQVDYSWWNIKHGWDGYTGWRHYMILSPGFMGPNAFPLPDLFEGVIPSEAHFEMGFEGHFTKGDQTANLYTEFYLPLFSDRSAIQINYRPVEAYFTDTITRDLRLSREYDPRGVSFGDLYFSTLIQVIKDHPKLPDVIISANIKTASGTKLEGARHTDTPGYWFDATISKKIVLERPSIAYLRIYGKGGFYAYQTFREKLPQNDAFLYGAGVTIGFKQFSLHNQFTGFAGYMENGDVPLVYRLILEGRTDHWIGYKIRFQQGIHDFSFTSLRISAILKFNRNSSHK